MRQGLALPVAIAAASVLVKATAIATGRAPGRVMR